MLMGGVILLNVQESVDELSAEFSNPKMSIFQKYGFDKIERAVLLKMIVSAFESEKIMYGIGCADKGQYITTENDAYCVAELLAAVLLQSVDGQVVNSITLDQETQEIMESNDFKALIENGFSIEQAYNFIVASDELIKEETLEGPQDDLEDTFGEITQFEIVRSIADIFEKCAQLLTGSRNDVTDNLVTVE